jgi:hypothetical protein
MCDTLCVMRADGLPLDILLQIFKVIHALGDLYSISLVCKTWNEAITSTLYATMETRVAFLAPSAVRVLLFCYHSHLLAEQTRTDGHSSNRPGPPS